jgi:hypothetical protein
MYDDPEKDLEGSGCGLIKVVSLNFPVGSEENHVSRPKFELSTAHTVH